MSKLDFVDQKVQPLPKVVVLLATHHDAGFLPEHLDSTVSQSYPAWVIWASDDSKNDATWNVLKQYQERIGSARLHLQKGPQKGFIANFLSLVCQPSIEADHFAYCDQDDIWEADKLECAVRWLANVPKSVPALYCSRTRLVDVRPEA